QTRSAHLEPRAPELGAQLLESGAAPISPLRARCGELALDASQPCRRALDARRHLREAFTQVGARVVRAPGDARQEPLLVARELGGDDPLARHPSEVPGEAETLESTDHPLARIPRRPRHAVAIIRGEAMVEVVVPLAEGEECGHHAVARR